MPGAGLPFVLVVAATSLLGVFSARFRPDPELPSLAGWTLAGRRLGPAMTWFLLGGTVYTAYTFVAVPGLVYGAGALGFFALPYTIVLWPLAFVVLPRMWRVWAAHGFLTPGDFVRARYDSPGLALAVALTGVLATMPYVALQLVGIRAALTAVGLYPPGALGDLALAVVFAVMAGATYRSGLRAPALISPVKAVAVFVVVAVVVVLAVAAARGPHGVAAGIGSAFDAAGQRLDATASGAALVLPPNQFAAYASLAVGSALALLMYPHVLVASAAASGVRTLRRACIALPAWTLLLAGFGLLGLAALAAGIELAPGRGELAMPQLVAQIAPGWLTGLVLAAVAVGALVPAAVMSVAVATTFTRNVYVEYLHPTATPKHQATVARLVSLAVKAGALVFVVGLRNQDAINLQLLGGVWILQTLPAVGIGLFVRWFHRGALLTGWATGMAVGTVLVVAGGFAAVVDVLPGPGELHVYAALAALAANLAVAAVLTVVLDRAGVHRGLDATVVS